MARLDEDPSHPRPPLQPWVLLLLAEEPAHGYELAERLRPLGFEWNDPGSLYQGLRRLEEAGWVTSTWDGSKRGPPRRIYELTPQGRAVLDRWAEGIGHLAVLFCTYQSRYEQLRLYGQPLPPTEPSTREASA